MKTMIINIKADHMKMTESPATSLLALTNTLQPVVRRCLLGWPAIKKIQNTLIPNFNKACMYMLSVHVISGHIMIAKLIVSPEMQYKCFIG